jgi:hypothetical protein
MRGRSLVLVLAAGRACCSLWHLPREAACLAAADAWRLSTALLN